jgi:hypothetical protein
MLQTKVKLLLLAVACAGQYQGFAASLFLGFPKNLPIQDDLANKPLPQWRDGVLVVVDRSPGSHIGISTYDRSGQRVSTLSFTVPGAKQVSVRGFTRGTDGTIALCGRVEDHEGRSASYLAWISADGTEKQVIRTSPFLAWRVAFAADGTNLDAGHGVPSAAGTGGSTEEDTCGSSEWKCGGFSPVQPVG